VACALRLTARLVGGPRPTVLAARGPFGERVAHLLAARWPDCVPCGSITLDEVFEVESSAVVVADSAFDLALCRQAARVSRERGRRWLPILMDHPLITLGPLTEPGRTGCFECYYRRRLQHAPRLGTSLALHEAYARDPQLAPKGFLPHHARLAAAVGSALLEVPSPAPSASRQVTSIHMLRNQPSTHRLLPYPDCDYCGEHPGSRPDGSRSTTATLLELARDAGARTRTDSVRPEEQR
jgi:bacteriocin biosynthesis cyclodehydratase domain-containing protein